MAIKVYTDHGASEHIPHPGKEWTRFVCISDTHSRLLDLPEGDVLLHAGDISSWGYPHQVKAVFDWLRDRPHPVKIVIGGNHDLCLDAQLPPDVFEDETPESLHAIREYVTSQEMKDAGVYYLEHESIEIAIPEGQTWKVHGSPAAPRYATGAFQYRSDDALKAQDIYGKIPEDVEVLLTHTPPYRILDLSRKGIRAGCHYLKERLTTLHACRLHVFGHMHEAFGVEILETSNGQRVAVNAAVASRRSKPIIVDITK